MSQPPRPTDDSFPYADRQEPPSFTASPTGQSPNGGMPRSPEPVSGGTGWQAVPPPKPSRKRGWVIASIIGGVGCVLGIIGLVLVFVIAIIVNQDGAPTPPPSPTPTTSASAEPTPEPGDVEASEPEAASPGQLFAVATAQGPATDVLEGTDHQAVRPTKGQFLPVTLQVRNSSSQAIPMRAVMFELTDSAGQTHRFVMVKGTFDDANQIRPYQDLPLRVYFDVPAGTVASKVTVRIPGYVRDSIEIPVP